MLKVVTALWDPNGHSFEFSRCYDESWVEKLMNGFRRNMNIQHEFVLYTDRERNVSCRQVIHKGLGRGGYGDFVKPYEMDDPMILVGLDTVITGCCDEMALTCLDSGPMLLPRDPYRPHIACNGVALVPKGYKNVALSHNGENDMDWVRSFKHAFIDDVYPGQVKSYKGHVKDRGIGDTRIVYFHGQEKPHQLPPGHPILEHWV